MKHPFPVPCSSFVWLLLAVALVASAFAQQSPPAAALPRVPPAALPDGPIVRQGEELRREWLLAELKHRIRDVRQGPDGLLYVLTEEDAAALLRIEPAD